MIDKGLGMTGILVEERRRILVEAFQDGAHQRFADETASVLDGILVAETVQRTHFTIIQHDTNAVVALFFLEFSITVWGIQNVNPKCKPMVTKLRPATFVKAVSVPSSAEMISVASIFACWNCARKLSNSADLLLSA